MRDEVLNPSVVRVAGGRRSISPPLIFPQALAPPIAHIEGRVGEYEVSLEIGMEIFVEAIGGLRAEIGVNATNGKVHARQTPGGGIGFLAVDGEVVPTAAVLLHEALGGYEHAARAAAGIEDPAAEGLEHRHQELDDALRCVELAAALAFRCRELAEEVLVDTAEDVLRAAGGVAEADLGDEVHELAETGLVQGGAAVVFGEDALERGVLLLDGVHGLVDGIADRRVPGQRLDAVRAGPAGFLGNPEDI